MKPLLFWPAFIFGCVPFAAITLASHYYWAGEPLDRALRETFFTTLFWGAFMAFWLKYLYKRNLK